MVMMMRMVVKVGTVMPNGGDNDDNGNDVGDTEDDDSNIMIIIN